MNKVRFEHGKVVATRGAIETMEKYHISATALLDRHVTGDWGDLTEEDKKENEYSVPRQLRILSAYGHGDAKLWVITEADRSATTILRPDEY